MEGVINRRLEILSVHWSVCNDVTVIIRIIILIVLVTITIPTAIITTTEDREVWVR